MSTGNFDKRVLALEGRRPGVTFAKRWERFLRHARNLTAQQFQQRLSEFADSCSDWELLAILHDDMSLAGRTGIPTPEELAALGANKET